MKRLISFIVLTLVVAFSYAQMNIKCVGKATQVVHTGDTLFIFKNGIELQTVNNEVADWYSTTNGTTPVLTNTAYAGTLDDGGYYIKQNGVTYSPFYVFNCKPADIAFTAAPSCTATTLHLTGDVAAYTYIRPDASMGTLARVCSINYNALAWNGEAWADSAVHTDMRLSRTLNLPAMYGPTDILLCYDTELRSKLDLDSACVEITLKDSDLVAIDFHLESLATLRGEKGEKSNELNRATDQKCITATTSDDYSGALEVAFYANPTSSIHPIYFRWDIYKANQHIATRTDQDIRYSFAEPGSYRVVCNVNSAACTPDSMEMKVNISESYLRVPNVFTPDGNGKNDEFRVSYRSLREFHCWVYNRWGKLVYDWTDPARGWDGTINGRKAAEGAYFYVIRAMGTDAAKDAKYRSKISYKKKTKNQDESVIGVYQMSGDINLLRRKE